jgi:hypothetical protein
MQREIRVVLSREPFTVAFVGAAADGLPRPYEEHIFLIFAIN